MLDGPIGDIVGLARHEDLIENHVVQNIKAFGLQLVTDLHGPVVKAVDQFIHT